MSGYIIKIFLQEKWSNSGDPDQTPRSATSDLGLHRLPVTRLGVSTLRSVKNGQKALKKSQTQLKISNDAQRTERVLMPFACNAGPDQPAHKRRLIWAFVVRI